MKSEKQQDLFNHFIRTSKGIMQETGQHIPQIFFVKNNEITTILMPFDDKSKDEIMSKVRIVFDMIKPESYYFVSESWMSERKSGDAYVRPKNDANRKEILMIIEFKSDLTSKNCVVPIIRDKDNKISFGKKRVMSGEGGVTQWNFYLEAEGVKEHMDSDIEKMQKEFLDKRSKELAHKYAEKIKNVDVNSPEFKQLAKEMYDDVIKFKRELLGEVDDDGI
jgi:hypothetical protein